MSTYRDSLPGGTRDRYDAAITAAAQAYARACADMAASSAPADSDKAA